MKEPKRLLDEPDSPLAHDLRALLENESTYDVAGGLEKFRMLATLPAIISGETTPLASDAPPSNVGATSLGVASGKFALFGAGVIGLASALFFLRPLDPPPSKSAARSTVATLSAPTKETRDSFEEPTVPAPEADSPRRDERDAPLPDPSRSAVRDAATAGTRKIAKTEMATEENGPTLALEMRELKEMRRFVATSPLTALTLVEHTRFPSGAFRPEREVVAIDALVRLGRLAEAKERGEKFLAREPNHPERSRVSRMLGLGSNSGVFGSDSESR